MSTPKIIIQVGGGCVTGILSNDDIEVAVMDADTEGADADQLSDIDGEGQVLFGRQAVDVDPAKVEEYWGHL